VQEQHQQQVQQQHQQQVQQQEDQQQQGSNVQGVERLSPTEVVSHYTLSPDSGGSPSLVEVSATFAATAPVPAEWEGKGTQPLQASSPVPAEG